MPGYSDLSIVTPGVALVLAVIYVALEPAHPERKPLPSQRMIRIAAKAVINLVVMVIVIVRLFASAFDWLGPTTDAEGAIAPIGWARAGLAAGPISAVGVGAILAVLALAAVATQYVAYRTFSRRLLILRLDSVWPATGTAERVVTAVGTVVVAGIGEEVVFRALLPAIVYSLTPMIVVAILVPFGLFVVLHYAQGYRGLLNAAAVGAAATVIFLVTQQLVWPILLHVVANLAATVVTPEIQKARVRRMARDAVSGRIKDDGVVAPPRTPQVGRKPFS